MPCARMTNADIGRGPFQAPRLRDVLAGVLTLAALGGLARGDVDPLSGIDFVRITHPGNAPWMGDGTPGDRAIGRGGVDYEYFIGRFEVTTSQWVQFFNAAYDRPAGDAPLPHLIPPTFWGAAGTTPINSSNPNARRWQVPAGNEMLPVGNISWRMAAMYCNWLHNGGAAAAVGGVVPRENFLDGAYDVSTFGYVGNVFTDQLTHHAGARYWIPTWDEHLKASHYDPTLNDGQGGWWTYNTTRDVATIPGPPPSMGGIGEANTGGWGGGPSPFSIPLGAYTDVTSPWGLFDTAGGTAEWTESVFSGPGLPPVRIYDGSWWVDGPPSIDRISGRGASFPSLSTFDLGLRVASSVPGPSSCMLLLLAGALGARRTRRGSHDNSHFHCSDMRRDAGIGAGNQRRCCRGARLG